VAILALPSLFLLLAFLLVELTVRARRPYVTSLDFLVNSREQQAQFDDASRVRVVMGDPLLIWRLTPNLRNVVWDLTPVTTNDRGLRYDRPVGRKAAGAFRILCVGDSVTFGFRVPHVFLKRPEAVHPDWLPYTVRMERALREANPGRLVEVIPLAVPGYSSHQGLAWLRRDIDELQPDVVTLLFGWNDICLRPRADHETMKTDALDVMARSVVCRSQALIYAWRRVHRYRDDGGSAAATGVMRVPVGRFVANHLAMVRLAEQHGARVLVVGPVYRDRVAYPGEGDRIASLRTALRNAMRAASRPYVEIPELTEEAYPGNVPLFLEHIHPNHKGHRLLAETLLRSLADTGLLGTLVPPRPATETSAP
jgi:lysophospholipase L1-like esterase